MFDLLGKRITWKSELGNSNTELRIPCIAYLEREINYEFRDSLPFMKQFIRLKACLETENENTKLASRNSELGTCKSELGSWNGKIHLWIATKLNWLKFFWMRAISYRRLHSFEHKSNSYFNKSFILDRPEDLKSFGRWDFFFFFTVLFTCKGILQLNSNSEWHGRFGKCKMPKSAQEARKLGNNCSRYVPWPIRDIVNFHYFRSFSMDERPKNSNNRS